MMTKKEAELEIKRLIAMFEDDVDIQIFKTPREYMAFREVRRQRLLAEDARKAEAEIDDLAKEKCLKCEIWKFAFEDYALAVGNKSPETYKLYRKLVRNGSIPMEVQLDLLVHIYIHNRVLSDFPRYLMSAYKKYPEELKDFKKECNSICLKDYIDTDGYITVYRGEYNNAACGSSIDLNRAVSFTLDYGRARFFACRLNPQNAVIYTAKVHIDDLIWYTDEREEKEVIIRPMERGGKLVDLKVEEVSPAEYYSKSNL